MIVRRAIDPMPFLIAWVRIRFGEVPWNTTAVIIIPVRSNSGVIEIM
jgi:hypothetical protein